MTMHSICSLYNVRSEILIDKGIHVLYISLSSFEEDSYCAHDYFRTHMWPLAC